MNQSRYLVDFEVESHSCLVEGFQTAVSRMPPDVEVQISNLSVEPGTDRPLLSVQVICTATDLDQAKELGIELLKKYLRYLALASNTTHRIHKLIRVLDWSPGKKEREYHQFERFPGSELPYEVLHEDLFRTLDGLLTIPTTPALDRALKWFAHGVQAEYNDDQFQFFWLTIELLAQLSKPKEKVNDQCPKCRSALFCSVCNSHPTHRPYPKQAIRLLMEQTMPEGGSELFELASEIRNAVMHGEDVEVIEASKGVELNDVVNKLGGLAWTALMNAFLRTPEARKAVGPKLSFLRTNMYTHQVLSMKVHMLAYSADPDRPRLSEFARPTLSMKYEKTPRGMPAEQPIGNPGEEF